MTADGVDLVDEDDAGRVLLALLEQVAHARRADADEHLDEVRAADREERHVGFAGDRAGEQRLAGSRRAHQQDALRDAAAELLELLRLLQELDDLLELFLRFVDAGDVLERHLLLRARRQLRLALAERQRLVAAALHLAHEEDPEADHQQKRAPRSTAATPTGWRSAPWRSRPRRARSACWRALRTGSARRCGTSRSSLVTPVISWPVITTLATRPGVGRRHELAEPDRLVVALELGREVPDQHADDDEHHPEQQALQSRVQAEPPKPLSLKIITACAGSVTRNASSIPCPATHTIRSASSTTSGTRIAPLPGDLPVDEEVLQLLAPAEPERPEPVAGPPVPDTASGPLQRSRRTTAATAGSERHRPGLDRASRAGFGGHHAACLGSGTSPGIDSGYRKSSQICRDARPAWRRPVLLVKTTSRRQCVPRAGPARRSRRLRRRPAARAPPRRGRTTPAVPPAASVIARQTTSGAARAARRSAATSSRDVSAIDPHRRWPSRRPSAAA